MTRYLWDSIALFLFWIGCPGLPVLHAQLTEPVHSVYQQTANFQPHLEQQHEVKTPFMSQQHLQHLLLFSTASFLIFRSDAAIDEEYARENHSFFFKLLKPVGRVGEVYDTRFTFPAMVGLSVLALGYSHIKESVEPEETVKLMWQALVISSLSTVFLKTLVGRHRPYTNDGQYAFNWLSFKLNSRYMSFPSGHSSSIFAMMTVLAKEVKLK